MICFLLYFYFPNQRSISCLPHVCITRGSHQPTFPSTFTSLESVSLCLLHMCLRIAADLPGPSYLLVFLQAPAPMHIQICFLSVHIRHRISLLEDCLRSTELSPCCVGGQCHHLLSSEQRKSWLSLALLVSDALHISHSSTQFSILNLSGV